VKTHRRLLQTALRYPGSLGWMIGLGLAAGLFAIPQAGVFTRIIEQAFLQHLGAKSLGWWLAGLLMLAVGRAALIWGSEAAGSRLAKQVKQHLRSRLLEQLTLLGPGGLRQERTGELTNTLTEGIEALDAYCNQYLPQIAYAICLPVAILAVVFPIDPLSGVVLVLTGPLIPLFMALIGSTATGLTKRQWKTLSRMSAYFLDIIRGLTMLKTLGRSREQTQTIAKVSQRFRQVTLAVLRVTFLSALTMELLSTLSTAVVAVQVGLRLLYGQVEFGPAFLVLVLAPEFYLPLRLLGLRFHAGTAGVAAAQRIFALLDEPAGKGEPDKTDKAINLAPGEIRLSEVSYIYPDGQAALQDVSFTLPVGQVTALVGMSGAGKSTLAGLLLGFWKPTRGLVEVNGQPLDAVSSETWLREIAWVSQNPYLFNDTIEANLRLGRSDASQEDIRQAACQAGLEEFIQTLPQGYNTLIGERGARLSGGQAQRLALARAFLKNAPVLILDEPTAHLDPLNEQQISKATHQLAHGRTVLMIAHRLRTLRQADQVVVLEAGRVIQQGTPRALALQPGRFQELLRGNQGNLGLEHVLGADPADAEAEETGEHVTAIGVPALPARNEPAQPSSIRQTLAYLFRLMQPYVWQITLSVILSFGAVASSVGLMASAAYIIAYAALQPSIAELQVAIVGVRFFGLARGVLRYLERLASHQATFMLMERLRVRFYQALEPLAPARLMYRRSGDLLNQIVGDINTLENFYVRAAAPLLTAGLTTLAAVIFFGQISPAMSMIMLCLLAVGGLGLPALALWGGLRNGQKLMQARTRLNMLCVDYLLGMPDLLAFNQAEDFLRKVNLAGSELAQAQEAAGRRNAWQNALGSWLAQAGMWAVLVVAIGLAQEGRLNGILIGALALAALTSFEAVQAIPPAAQHLAVDMEAARRLLDVIRDEAAVPAANNTKPLPQEFSLSAEAVCFAYPPEAPDEPISSCALDGISFQLSPGKRLAIVGQSGAGKSTLVNLLLRLWDYNVGKITLGGIDLRELEADALRQAFAVVPQQPYLFNTTIRENLRLWRPEASEAEMVQACQAAQIDALIQSLPQGYDTWLGESGQRLSAGERQRLTLAGALLKDARLLILDEPAAHLDPQTEQAIHRALAKIPPYQAVLTITHRISGLDLYDEILVFHQGRIIERGNFNELLARGGWFYTLWALEQETI
jgi:ATP-binding cassette, subfamily C, bacterial CydCD